MKKFGRPHEWYTGFVAYEPYEACQRCGVRKAGAPEFCLTDNELKEREAWREHADAAARAMRRSRKWSTTRYG